MAAQFLFFNTILNQAFTLSGNSFLNDRVFPPLPNIVGTTSKSSEKSQIRRKFMRIVDSLLNSLDSSDIAGIKKRVSISGSGTEFINHYPFLKNFKDVEVMFKHIPSISIYYDSLIILRELDNEFISTSYKNYYPITIIISLLKLSHSMIRINPLLTNFCKKIARYGNLDYILYIMSNLCNYMKDKKIDNLESIGVIFPENSITQEQRMLYIAENFQDYEDFYTKRYIDKTIKDNDLLKELKDFQTLKNEYKSMYLDKLKHFNDKELMRFFPYVLTFKSRKNTLDLIFKIEVSLCYPWSFMRGEEINGNKMEILSGDLKKEITKPTISYGNVLSYKIFSLEELTANCKTDTILNPDHIDKRYLPPGENEEDECFSPEDIVSLRITLNKLANVLINTEDDNLSLNDPLYLCSITDLNCSLPEKIRIRDINTLKKEFSKLTKDERSEVEIYATYLFLLSLFSRFWRGFNYDFPYFKKHVFKEDLIFREFMVNIYFDIKGRIFDDFSENSIKYIKTLPLIIEGRVCLKEVESFINDNMSEVGRCTAETSNTLMETVKELFTNIICKDYNVLLKENFWYFNYYEKQVIELYLKLTSSKKGSEKSEVYLNRYKDLLLEKGVKYKFDMRKMNKCLDTLDLTL